MYYWFIYWCKVGWNDYFVLNCGLFGGFATCVCFGLLTVLVLGFICFVVLILATCWLLFLRIVFCIFELNFVVVAFDVVFVISLFVLFWCRVFGLVIYFKYVVCLCVALERKFPRIDVLMILLDLIDLFYFRLFAGIDLRMICVF